MRVDDVCGAPVEVNDLNALCARFPWVRARQPASFAEGLQILSQTACTLVLVGQAPAPLGKVEPPLESPTAFDAVRWMAGAEPLAPEVERAALLQEDGDAVAGALRAYGQDAGAAQSVRSWLRSVGRKAPPDGEVEVKVVSGDEAAAAEIGRAAKEGGLRRSSKGQLYAQDPESKSAWLLRPSPNAQRAAAFFDVAQAWGLGHYVLPAAVVALDGQPHLAERPPPKECSTMDDVGRDSVNSVRLALLPLLQDGSLHRWAALDYVLGNPDRVGSTVLLSESGPCFLRAPEGAFAERFEPPTDGQSFLPAYMRAWGPARWSGLKAREKLRYWPGPPDGMGEQLGEWLRDLPDESIRLIGAKRGLDVAGPLQRLERLRRESAVNGFGLALARAWCG